MGRAIMVLIGNELRSVVEEPIGHDGPVFSGLAEQRLEARKAKIEARERAVDEAEERLSEWTKRLRAREVELKRFERQARDTSGQSVCPTEPRRKVGRNERCPCQSSLKYKHCHGLAGQAGVLPDNG